MTAVDRDPVALAREVLDLTHEDETVTVCSVPDNKVAALARAVTRVEDLADRLEHEAAYEASQGDHWDAASLHVEALNIRLALNGDAA